MEMPQSSVEGLGRIFFAGGGKNIPFYCKISRIGDAMGLLATRASRHCGAYDPWWELEAERCSCWGTYNLFFQVFSMCATMQTGVIALQLMLKTWEGSTTQQLTMRRAKEGEGAASITRAFYWQIHLGDEYKFHTSISIENSKNDSTINFQLLLIFFSVWISSLIHVFPRGCFYNCNGDTSWFKDMNSVLQNSELLVSTFLVENTQN